ncbi:hypothetical protein ABZ746_32700 [Streptomyces sp. NPDC020096]
MAFSVLCGLCWTATYVLAIRAGVRDRTFAMPVVALATNISWEFQFAFIRPPGGFQDAINITWFLFDCGLVYTVLRYGPREFPYLKPRVFYPSFAGLLALAYAGMDLVSTQLDAGQGAFTAFGSNVAMSGLFLAMLAARGSSRGQSLGIAATKLAGTAAASVSWYLRHDPAQRYQGGLLTYCSVACFVLDLGYLLVLAAVIRKENGGQWSTVGKPGRAESTLAGSELAV